MLLNRFLCNREINYNVYSPYVTLYVDVHLLNTMLSFNTESDLHIKHKEFTAFAGRKKDDITEKAYRSNQLAMGGQGGKGCGGCHAMQIYLGYLCT